MAIEKVLLAKLKLDSKKFSSDVKKTTVAVGALSAAGVGVTTALFAMAKATADFQDQTIKAARTAGSTAEEFSRLKFAADLSAVSQERLVQSLAKLNAPTKQMQGELKKLGVEFKDSSGQMRNQNAVLNDLADGFAKLKNPADKSAAAVRLFGQRGVELVNLLQVGSAGLKEMGDEAEALGLTFSEKAGENAELFNDNLVRLTSSLEGVRNKASESIIAFVNQEGIITSLTATIQKAIKFINSIDEETKNTIISVVAAAGAFSGVLLVLTGVVAIGPSVAAAFATMTGGIGLAAIAIVALTVAVAKFSKSNEELADSAKKSAEQLQDNASVLETLGKATDLTRTESKKLATAKAGLATAANNLGIALLDENGKLKTQVLLLAEVRAATIKKIRSDIAAVKSAIEVAVELEKAAAQMRGFTIEQLKAATAAEKSLNPNLLEAAEAIRVQRIETTKSRISLKSLEDTLKSISKPLQKLTRETEEQRKKTKDLRKEPNVFDSLNVALVKFDKTLKPTLVSQEKAIKKAYDFSNVVKAASSKFLVLTDAAKQLADTIVEDIKRANERVQRDLEIAIGQFTKFIEKQIEETERIEQEKIDTLKDSFDKQISDLETAERDKLFIVENGAKLQLAVLDEQFKKEKELRDLAFQQFVDDETLKFEFEKEQILQKALDKEQRQIDESLLDEDFKNFIIAKEAEHEKSLLELAKNFAANQKGIDVKAKTEAKLLQVTTDDEIKKLQEERDAALLKAETEKDNKLTALEEEKNNTLDALRRKSVLAQFESEKASLESTKAIQVASTIASGVAGAAGAFAATAGALPFGLGVPIGLAIAGTILAATFKSAAQIASQEVLRPAELSFQSGGVIGGNRSHAGGGISANLESGEAVVDKERTSRLFDAIDSGSLGTTLTINFEPGSIVSADSIISDEMVETFSLKIAQRIEREGVII